MAQLIKWPSIEQFRNVVKNVQMKVRYKGKDENGETIFDTCAILPKLKFEGTVKLHGTNGSVCLDANNKMWVQSRENIITPMKDNAGFAAFVERFKEEFTDLLVAARDVPSNLTGNETVVVFGEWCGKGIQKGVAVSELPKMFVIFGITFADSEGKKTHFTRKEVERVIEGCRKFVKRPGVNSIEDGSNGVFCIYDFPTFDCQIDFENPHEIQNTLNQITADVEHECPVGKAFGVSGVGEGVVWRCIEPGFSDSGFWFKVKGEKHSNSKVKTLATVDVERINNINELAKKLAHNGRLEQGVQTVFDTLNGGEVDIKRFGEFIKWVMQDCFKEEMDTITASGFTSKELNGPISKLARNFLMQQLERDNSV